MRWVYLVVLYFVILPVTVYTFQRGSIFSFALDLLFGYSVAFAIGLVFRKSTSYPEGNKLPLRDYRTNRSFEIREDRGV
jgi:hypothetical protein